MPAIGSNMPASGGRCFAMYAMDSVLTLFSKTEPSGQTSAGFWSNWDGELSMRRTITRRQRCAGQSLVECALVIPLLLLLIVNVVNFGAFLYAWITVANAARTGAQYLTT